MIINILFNKYEIDSQIGQISFEQRDLLKDLNSLIEWDYCKFPIRVKEGGSYKNESDLYEDREFLGNPPVLKPGDQFYWNGNIFAINSETELVQLKSETGILAIKRFCQDIVKSEVVLISNHDVDSVEIKEVSEPLPEDLKQFSPKFEKVKLFGEKYLTGRFEYGKILEITVKSEEKYLLGQQKFYLDKYKVRYSGDEIEDDEISDTVDSGLGWLYVQNPRIEVEEEEEKEEEKKEEGN